MVFGLAAEIKLPLYSRHPSLPHSGGGRKKIRHTGRKPSRMIREVTQKHHRTLRFKMDNLLALRETLPT